MNEPRLLNALRRHLPGQEPFPRFAWMVLVAAMVALAPGCAVVSAPQKVVTAVVPLGKSPQPDPVDLQLDLQRFADDSSMRTSQALDAYAERAGTEGARVEALRLKLLSGSSLVSIVSGPNPSANLLDMVSVAVLTRLTIEDYWMKKTNGALFQPWLEVSRDLETNVWLLAARFLPPAQVEELRLGIEQWYLRTPELRTAFFARPHELASMVRTTEENKANVNSVFSLVRLDPTAGLDPAVREVTRTRLFAERAMFTLQRMPFLLRMQTDLLGHELTAQPSVQLALSNTTRLADSADRISRAAESLSQTAAQLPDRIATERKEILATLEQQEGKLRGLASEVDRALVSAERMSASLNIAITNFDGLMKRFGVGEPSTNATPDRQSPPFNVLDYAKTAGQIGEMAKELNTLVGSVNQSTPQIQRLSGQARAEAQGLVDHAFRLGLVLIAVLLAGGLLAGLLFRFLAGKLSRHPSIEQKETKATKRGKHEDSEPSFH